MSNCYDKGTPLKDAIKLYNRKRNKGENTTSEELNLKNIKQFYIDKFTSLSSKALGRYDRYIACMNIDKVVIECNTKNTVITLDVCHRRYFQEMINGNFVHSHKVSDGYTVDYMVATIKTKEIDSIMQNLDTELENITFGETAWWAHMPRRIQSLGMDHWVDERLHPLVDWR